RLSAYEAIRQLVARYAVAVDARDIETLVSLFVEDVHVGSLGTRRAALRESFELSLHGIGVSILNVGTHVIDLVGQDDAKGIVYCKGEIQDGTRWIHQAIVYEDRYRKVAGAWYFTRRNHRLFYGAEVGTNPLGLPPANWPQRHDGWGTVPGEWDSWRRFWADSTDGSATDGSGEETNPRGDST
ncbi:MAG: nuclear transport factor 2 family protein, partial [Acidimicrobiales bacterium]